LKIRICTYIWVIMACADFVIEEGYKVWADFVQL